MANKFFTAFTKTHLALEQIFAGRTDVYVDLANASALNDSVLVRHDGSLVSLIRIDGVLSIRSGESFQRYLERLVQFFSSYLAKPGHVIQFVFRRDPAGLPQVIDEIFQPARMTLDQVGLDWSWILESRKNVLSKFCAVEDVWLAFETNLSWLSKDLAKRVLEERKNYLKDKIFADECIWDIEPARIVFERHVAAITAIKTEFDNAGMICEVLDVKKALWEIRHEIDPSMTGKDWCSKLLTDKIPIRVNNHEASKKNLASLVLPPSLAKQLIPRPFRYTQRDEFVRIGDRIYAPVIVTVPPVTPQSFAEFLRTMINMDASVPFRISFRLHGDGLSHFALKRTLSSLFSFASRDLRYIRMALNEIDEMQGEGIPSVGLQISCVTWVDDREEEQPPKQIGLLSQRGQMLVQALQAWGQIESSMMAGLPALETLATVPAITTRECAPMAAAPITQVIGMLPLNRQGSPWRQGALLFRSGDGKLLPFQPGSTLQSSWATIGFAPPGSGKSVLLSTMLIASIMSPGRQTIPYIGVIDIGPSSRGLIDLLRASLPEDQKHLAIYEKLSNSTKYAINPFDTPLGADRPTPQHKAMLVDFVTTLCTPDGQLSAPAGVANLVTEAISLLYERLARGGEAERRFDETRDGKLTEFINLLGLERDEHTTWWEIVDKLFEKGYEKEASWAQRYAVPTLGDLAVVVNSDQRLQAKFTGRVGETEQRITDYVYEFITAAIGRYPMLSESTRFTLETARVVSLNLEAVAPSGSESARKQSAIMYLLARHALMSRCRIEQEILEVIPQNYRAYYLKKMDELGPEVKIISYDEFHRTSGIEGIRNQIDRDVREGRKYNTQVLIFSQDFNDFTDTLMEFATTQFILGSGGDQISGTEKGKAMQSRFGLDDSDLKVIDRLTGPTEKGAMAFMLAKTRNGACKMLVYNTIGATERWALETNAYNRALRDKVIGYLGLRHGLELLAKRFPTGSAAEEIERFAMEQRGAVKEEEIGDVVEHFVREVLNLS